MNKEAENRGKISDDEHVRSSGSKDAEQGLVEVVTLGRRFQLFRPENMQLLPIRPGVFDRISEYVLDAQDVLPHLPPLPLRAIATANDLGAETKLYALTPFDPSLGYRITNADFQPSTRGKKFTYLDARLDFNQEEPTDNRIGLLVGVTAYQEYLEEQQMKEELYLPYTPGSTGHFIPEILEQLRRLRLQLFFPKGSAFETRPSERGFQIGSIDFDGGFYPLDTGPLPIPKGYERFLEKGFELAVPNDLQTLQQIQAHFICVDQALEGR